MRAIGADFIVGADGAHAATARHIESGRRYFRATRLDMMSPADNKAPVAACCRDVITTPRARLSHAIAACFIHKSIMKAVMSAELILAYSKPSF